jgi:hypothetical protein
MNVHLGEVVVEMMTRQDGGELPADGVRELGQRLGTMSADLLARAAELDGRMIETPARVVIDARP